MNWFTRRLNNINDKIGFSFNNRQEKIDDANKVVAVQPQLDDGSFVIQNGGGFETNGYALSTQEANLKNSTALITKYREISLYPEIERAVEDIINEAISSEDTSVPVRLVLDNVPNLSEKVKNRIINEFEEILGLLNFKTDSYELFKKWYVDGRIYFYKIIEKDDPKKGLVEIRYVDPRKIHKIIEKIPPASNQTHSPNRIIDELNYEYEEYFVYNPDGIVTGSMTGVKIPKDTVTYVTSGLTDASGQIVISHLHKTIRPLNQLRATEDAMLIYRLTRSTEKRVFYIDTGELPPQKSEQYVNSVKNKIRNKINYDATTGEAKSTRQFMSINDDFFIARNGSNSGTSIESLKGADNINDTNDVDIFKKNLHEALGIPLGRLNQEGSFNIGRSGEILRDEIKFAKFISRLRRQFSEIFDDLLKTQLALKGVMKIEEYEDIQKHMFFDWKVDNMYAELNTLQILQERLNVVGQMTDQVGLTYSLKWIRNNVLGQTNEDIAEIDKQIKLEGAKKIISRKQKDDEILNTMETDPLGLGGDMSGLPEPDLGDGTGQMPLEPEPTDNTTSAQPSPPPIPAQ